MFTFDFSNKTLLLSGANGGIGRAIATLFYANGANLALADRSLTDGLQAFAQDLDPEGKRVKVTAMDVSLSSASEAFTQFANEHFGRIDYVVPAAGIYRFCSIHEMNDEAWQEMLAINLDGVYYLIKKALPYMGQGGTIVNISSVAAWRGAFANVHYSAAKGALLSLTKSLARELAPDIRVNAVSPGVIDTTLVSELIQTRGEATLTETLLQRYGQAHEVASVIGFLCSEASSFITGENIHINGGLYMA